MNGEKEILKMHGISKSFPGVRALDNVEFSLRRGEVHALLGENGAGKSTLMKILGGIYNADSGDIFIDGEKAVIDNVHDAQNCGISIIHQELILVPHMTVAENIFLGRERLAKNRLFTNDSIMYAETEKLLNKLCDNVSPDNLISDLSVGQQQMVEITKSLSFNAKIIVMDEPTAALSDREVNLLFELIRNLRKEGIAIVYISHRMEELFEISDRVTVLRDGMYIGTKTTSETTRKELVDMMVGRELSEYFKTETHEPGDVILDVQNLTVSGKISDVSFQLKKGEILGVSGIVGAGRTELVRALFGIDKPDSGKIILEGTEVHFRSPLQAIKSGIALVPENRKEEGLFLEKEIGYNLTIQVLDDFIKLVLNNRGTEADMINESISKFSIKTAGHGQVVNTLSGGNQQKIVIAKWLLTKPKVLILDEPTRGVDVGAKSEIYSIISRLAKEGVAIIMVSSELPEIVNLSDRVLVMAHGEVTAVLGKKDISQSSIMHYATGSAVTA